MSEEVKKSFSFGFAKKSSVKKLEDSKLRDDSTKDKHEETDFIIEVDRSEIKGTKKKEVKEELIIPYLPNTYKKKIEVQPVKSENEEQCKRMCLKILLNHFAIHGFTINF